MQIIDDTEVFEPQECYFACFKDANSTTQVLITPIDFWNYEGCLSDGIGPHSFNDDSIPNGIHNTMEACWETDLSVKDAKDVMIRAGFVFSEIMTNEMKDLF